MELFKFEGTINTRTRGIIKLTGELPHNLRVEEEVLTEGTFIIMINDNDAKCKFTGQSAFNLLLIELNQITKPTIH